MEAYYSRGSSYTRTGDYRRALEDYTHVIDLNSGFVDAYRSRGAAYRGSGDQEKAIRDFKKVLELSRIEAQRSRLKSML